MGHKIRFDPVDIEIEVEESETILNGAFRQGLMLMHGCKEGQCSACKAFLLDGDIDMDRYSTFALADYEREEGYVLLCQSHAFSDVEIELLHVDEDMLHMGTPIQTVQAEVEEIEVLTHDIRRLLLRLVEPREMAFSSGQYVDITIPGTDRTRSFSMANTPETDDHLEFIIKLYPDGHFSGLLEGRLVPGDSLSVTGPYGLCTLRPSSQRDLVLVGGGAGMAPLLSLLRSLADEGSTRRATFYYGARGVADLFYLEELSDLGRRLPGLRFVPALSDLAPGDEWQGETGFVTDIVERCEGDLSDVDAYLCGPPPMIDAAIPLLVAKGVDEAHIYFDKFTVSADSDAAKQ